jgi:mannose-6-phosphate isomerase
VNCQYFTTNFIPLDGEMRFEMNKESFSVYMCVEGSFELIYEKEKYVYKTGDTILIPAEITEFEIKGKASVLEIYIS